MILNWLKIILKFLKKDSKAQILQKEQILLRKEKTRKFHKLFKFLLKQAKNLFRDAVIV